MPQNSCHYIPLSSSLLDLPQTEVPVGTQCSILTDIHHKPVRKSSHTK